MTLFPYTLLIPYYLLIIVISVEFVDPYNSIWLKLITVVVYAVELMSSAIMLRPEIYSRGPDDQVL